MVVFPNAKINLGLNVLSKREDGYHNISSCFYPIDWSDVLEIIPSKEFEFTSSGLAISGVQKNNLCVKAYDLLKELHQIPPVHIHLHKVIPMGAGLGGGSSDGAFTLKLLNQIFNLQISSSELQVLAGKLGSDCTFFIKNVPSLVFEIGDKIEPISLSLKDYSIMIIHPNFHIGTVEAYQGIIPKEAEIPIQSVIEKDICDWKGSLQNDFELSVFKRSSELLEIKNLMYKNGAEYASMSGSGSSIYGIFQKNKNLDFKLENSSTYLRWIE